MKAGDRAAFNAAGKPIETVTVRWRDNALHARCFGDGQGIYLDPAEQRAAQGAAELLHRLRTEAGRELAGTQRYRRRSTEGGAA